MNLYDFGSRIQECKVYNVSAPLKKIKCNYCKKTTFKPEILELNEKEVILKCRWCKKKNRRDNF